MPLNLRPQKREFFDLYTQASANARDIARALVELIDEWPASREKLRDIRELEHEGVIELRHGSGAFVAKNARAGRLADTLRRAQGLVAATVERLRAQGLSEEEIRRLFEAELAGLTRTGGRRG